MSEDAFEDVDFYSIDPNSLDEEWLRHPEIYHKHALLLAQARAEYEQAKAQLELVVAELDRDVRNDPTAYDIGKLTEGSVDKAVHVQESYVRANKKVLRTRHNMDVAQAAVNTLEHKKKALEKMVDLWLSDYRSTPRSRQPASREHVEQLERDKIRRKGQQKRDIA